MSFTANKREQYCNGELSMICDAYCKSTDTKETEGIPNGASLVEIDTGNYYLFDIDAKQWVFQLCIQG